MSTSLWRKAVIRSTGALHLGRIPNRSSGGLAASIPVATIHTGGIHGGLVSRYPLACLFVNDRSDARPSSSRQSVSSPQVVCAEAPRIRLRDRDERVNNLWGELAALNERLAGGDPVFARKRIDYLR